MCWWWHKIRKADIPDDVRRAFEETGEFSVQAELAANYPPAKPLLRDKYPDGKMKIYGHAWVLEQFDRKARREDRLETVEVAILVFVIVGVVADLLLFGHELKWF